MEGPTPMDVDSGTWSCSICTYFNPIARSRCEMCDADRPQGVQPPKPSVPLRSTQPPSTTTTETQTPTPSPTKYEDDFQKDIDIFSKILTESGATSPTRKNRLPLKSISRTGKESLEFQLQCSEAFEDLVLRFSYSLQDLSAYPSHTSSALKILGATRTLDGPKASYPDTLGMIISRINKRLAQGDGRASLIRFFHRLCSSLFLEDWEKWVPKLADDEALSDEDADAEDLDEEEESHIGSQTVEASEENESGWALDIDSGIPEEIRTEVESDIEQLSSFSGYFGYASPDDALGTILVRVALSLHRLGISEEQSIAWNMNSLKCVVVSMQLPKYYIRGVTPPAFSDLKVFQSKVNSNEDLHILPEDVSSFGLEWLVRDRLMNGLFSKWPPKVTPWEEKKKLLSASNDSQEKEEIPKEGEKKTEEGWMDKFTYAPGVLELLELFPYVSSVLAYLALEKAGEGLSQETALARAAEILMNPSDLASLERELDSNFDRLSKGPRKRLTGDSKEKATGLEGSNFLIRLLEFVEYTIATCTFACMICNHRLEYGGFKPVVCDNALCLYKYEELGLGVDLSAEIRNDPEVVDLLISFCAASVHAGRIELCFPENVRAKQKSGGEISFMNKNQQNTTLLNQVISCLPPVLAMAECETSKELKERLDKAHPLCYPLLRWIVTSNRSHLRKLKPKEKVNVPTDHQFILLSQPPEKEAQFRREKERKGTFYRFHGSPFSNWHSILRQGLQVKGKGLGTSGAAIWMANDFSTSHGYCMKGGAQAGWERSMFGGTLYCMALLEVIKDPGKGATGQPICVVTDVNIIMTRFFLVFPNSMPAHNVQADTIPVRDFKL